MEAKVVGHLINHNLDENRLREIFSRLNSVVGKFSCFYFLETDMTSSPKHIRKSCLFWDKSLEVLTETSEDV